MSPSAAPQVQHASKQIAADKQYKGIVDCIVVEDDGVTVLDFKTDHVWAQALQARAEEYALQLRVYAKAMARLLQKPVKRCVLVFLFTGESVEIPLTGK